MAVKAEAKVEVARTDDMMAVATMTSTNTPTVTAEAPIGHTTISGMTHACGTMENLINDIARPLPIHATATVADVTQMMEDERYHWRRRK